MMVQALYNIVDSIFVSRISENALAAATLVFPVQMMMISVLVGGGVGLSSLIARRLGEKRFIEANEAASHGFFIAMICWLTFAAFGFFGAEPFFWAFSEDGDIVSKAIIFCRILTIGSIFLCIQINSERILQATGNTLMPMVFNMIGALTNICLNPILIFGLFGAPKMGIAGSATATLIAQFIAASIATVMVFRCKHDVRIKFRGFKPKKKILGDIYSVGLPSIIMQGIASVTLLGLNAILMGMTSTAVAVLGLYFRMQSLIFMPVFGLNQGSMPILGYNYGARKKDRLMDCYKKATFVAIAIMTIGMAVFQLLPVQILQLYEAEPEMMHIGTRALRIISLCFIPTGLSTVALTLFQALGHGVLSMVVSVIRQVALILPFAWVLARFLGVDFVWFAYPLSDFFCIFLIVFFVYRVYAREIKTI
jgi:putative MATE family efflux protein